MKWRGASERMISKTHLMSRLWSMRPFALRTVLEDGSGRVETSIIKTKCHGKFKLSILAQTISCGRKISLVLFVLPQVFIK
jgi:hypothetical protein